jgi:hypothetical protein
MKKSIIAILLMTAWSFCFAQNKGEIIGQPDSVPIHIKLNPISKPLDIRVPIMKQLHHIRIEIFCIKQKEVIRI